MGLAQTPFSQLSQWRGRRLHPSFRFQHTCIMPEPRSYSEHFVFRRRDGWPAADDGAAGKSFGNGDIDGTKAKSGVRLLVGLFKMFNNAVATSVGATPPGWQVARALNLHPPASG